MAIEKNVAGQSISIFAVDSSGIEKTGDAANITAYISKDGAAGVQTNDINPTEVDSVRLKGVYDFNLTQEETNCDKLILSADSSTAGVVIRPVIIYTVPRASVAGVVSSSPYNPDLANIDELLQDVIHETNIGDVPDFFRVVNRLVREMSKERQWRHYITRDTITLSAVYTTGTVTLTEGSATVVGDGTTFTSGMVGWKFVATDGNGVYTITAFTDTEHITISPAWASDDLADADFQIYQDTYDFPSDMMMLLEVLDSVTERPLNGIEWTDAVRRWESFTYTDQTAIPPTFAWPWEYVQHGFNAATGCYQVIVNALAETERTLDVVYRRWPGDVTKITDTPDIPKYLEEVLRLRLFKYFIRRRDINNEVQFADRKQRLAEWDMLEAAAMYTAKTTDGMMTQAIMRNHRTVL